MENRTDFITEFKSQARLRMGESLEKIRACLKLLDDEAFWYCPNTASNSAGQLLVHLSGNIRQYILSGLRGEADVRQREKEFRCGPELPRAEVEARFFEVAETAIDIIETLPEEAFAKTRKVQGFSLTGLGIVLHVVEHLSYHTGQLAYLTKMEKDTDLGFYRGIDLNASNE